MKIPADIHSKAYAKESILIEAPPPAVFKFLADVSNWLTWQKSVSKSSMDGEAEPGKNFIWKSGGMKIQSKFHTVIPFTEIGWTGKMWWIGAVHNWSLEDKNDDCLVTVEESLHGALSSFMKKSLRKSIIRNLQELKAAVEKQHG